ncbi:MAG: transposase [Ruminococcus sp.]|uniref:helix-turn-helix domain-containing protein n=1 Tax=Ruminococcus sp. TaxID=41978 RepID=UPI0025D82FE2|nr:transposase [Ruminococcus sp.]MBR6996225.1 transposase [Ruminococcus sp.]
MAKYSYEFKKEVVDAYNKNEGSYGYLAKKFKIPNKAQIERWVSAYNTFGDDGLRRSRKKEIYSFQKKLSVVELYLSGEISYQELNRHKKRGCG